MPHSPFPPHISPLRVSLARFPRHFAFITAVLSEERRLEGLEAPHNLTVWMTLKPLLTAFLPSTKLSLKFLLSSLSRFVANRVIITTMSSPTTIVCIAELSCLNSLLISLLQNVGTRGWALMELLICGAIFLYGIVSDHRANSHINQLIIDTT